MNPLHVPERNLRKYMEVSEKRFVITPLRPEPDRYFTPLPDTRDQLLQKMRNEQDEYLKVRLPNRC